MMENKYFTPLIEDIRVGYECEINKSFFNGISEGWHNFIFKEFEQLEVVNRNGLKAFRVPYLTKEQIEAEGWKFEGGLVDHIHFSKERSQLIWFKRGNSIELQNPANLPMYIGGCKDINTFRYICKLLNN